MFSIKKIERVIINIRKGFPYEVKLIRTLKVQIWYNGSYGVTTYV